jgi:hypothetical protein
MDVTSEMNKYFNSGMKCSFSTIIHPAAECPIQETLKHQLLNWHAAKHEKIAG